MKARNLLLMLAFGASCTLLGGSALAQEKKDEKKAAPAPAKPTDKPTAPAKAGDKPAAAIADPSTDPMMAAGMPGEGHAKLKGMEGSWNAAVKFWMDPASEPAESKGTCERKWIMDGRFMEETHNGDLMGMPFKGYGITGYDNAAKKYVSSWVDNMGTGIMYSTGTADPSGKVFTYTSENVDPMTGKMVKSKSVIKIINDTKHVFEMYMVGDDGKESKALEVTYTKK